VDPGRGPVPDRRLERPSPGIPGARRLDDPVARANRRARLGVELAERLAASTGRIGDNVEPSKRGNESGEVVGRLLLVADRRIGVRLALNPAIDRPPQWIALGRATLADRLRNGQWQVRRQPGEPLQFLLEMSRPFRQPWQPGVRSSPIRKIALTVPVERDGRIGRPARRGN
jgi:hypothetical protein